MILNTPLELEVYLITYRQDYCLDARKKRKILLYEIDYIRMADEIANEKIFTLLGSSGDKMMVEIPYSDLKTLISEHI